MKTEPSYRYSFSTTSKEPLWSRLRCHIPWQRENLRMYGREIAVPRKVAFVGDQGVCYRYSGVNHYGEGWPIWLQDVRHEAERLAGQTFNSVLLNYYVDGTEYMGWHSDDEKELGAAPVIAMLSLGAEREFLFRLKQNHQVKHKILLEDTSWLIMSPSTQVLWQHSLPKRLKVKEERISLTFRSLLSS